jgi:NAD+ synthase (glutamine-hydrolysing)
VEATGIERAVIGVSGALDSAQALLARVFDRLSLPRSDVLAVTMPGLATSAQTRQAACDLMQALGVAASEIDIRPSAEQMSKDLQSTTPRSRASWRAHLASLPARQHARWASGRNR